MNIHVWKLGNHYDNKEDKNGGKAEFNYIYNAIADAVDGKAILRMNPIPSVEEEKDKVVTFIVNGIMSERDECRVKIARRTSDIIVYIITDYGFIEDNKPVIELCDYVLHQSPMEGFSLMNKPGAYSFVPELFYDEKLPVAPAKMDLCFFGGNQAGRSNEFNEYILDADKSFGYPMSVRSGMAAFYKSNEGDDFRVPYKDYRRILSLFKFAFVSGRSAGKDVGWVTPRLVEAVNADCIPILINDYDRFDHFGFQCHRVKGYKELQQFMEESDEIDMGFILDRAKNDFRQAQKDFKLLIRYVISEIRPLHSI